ncbi:hypothetical protein THIOM_001032 [Candidatus Thiomargarita nelsonii]|uniref:Uncharacterized protein n=1 Tax=Candidatus Thiomargarita nelsonii TaxID=1003181 RepID=A0A176S4W1_9GAMM|nr:hypothetical protein THIOM_001032 [Candidatus Thiomargarita nelsonii]
MYQLTSINNIVQCFLSIFILTFGQFGHRFSVQSHFNQVGGRVNDAQGRVDFMGDTRHHFRNGTMPFNFFLCQHSLDSFLFPHL